MRSGRLRTAIVVLGTTAALLAGCGSEETPTMTDDQTAAPSTELGSKPPITLLEDRGAPPTALQVNDAVVGDGDEATAGSRVTVHYVGVSWSSGAQFDASWDRGQPFEFTLGAGEVIPGWDQGVEGMRVGGRRTLVIPPDLAYGERGAGGVIGPNETLVFVVDLLAVTPA